MANEQAQAGTEKKAKRSLPLSTVIIIVLLLVVIGCGAFLFLGRQSAPPAAAEAATAAPAAAVEAAPAGVVVRLDPIFINLKGGRFLKLGLALQTTQEEGGGHGGGGASVDGAYALDAAIEVFSDQDIVALSSIDSRAKLKQELIDRVVEGYGPSVTTVYFTEFVMQ